MMRKLDKSAHPSVRLSVRITRELLSQIEKQAEIERRTLGQMVRIILEDRLAELRKNKK